MGAATAWCFNADQCDDREARRPCGKVRDVVGNDIDIHDHDVAGIALIARRCDVGKHQTHAKMIELTPQGGNFPLALDCHDGAAPTDRKGRVRHFTICR